MRVLTYNIHGWRGQDNRFDVPRLARIIRESGAGLIALNEVFHPLVHSGSEQPALDQLAEMLGMTYAFGPALTPQLAFAPHSAYGNALVTRYKLLAHASHHLTPVEGHEQRGLLEARVLLDDGTPPLSVYVTHLDYKSEEVRMKQVRALLQWTLRDRIRPHLLLGDFNALAPEDYRGRAAELAALQRHERLCSRLGDPIQVLPRLVKAGYVDGAAGKGVGQSTFPSDEPRVRIDYILASSALAPALVKTVRFETDETAIASDHYPVIAEFDWSSIAGSG